jgi:parallel beta-helix repeat protein
MKLHLALIGLILSVLGTAALADESKSDSKVPKVLTNGGLRFQSEGAGIPNTLSGYIVAPLHQSENGNVLFIDGFANWNFGGELSDSSFGASTRIGYRWLNDARSWMLGANAGVDTTPYQDDYNWQAGLGLEALNRNVEIRANGYIPLRNSNEEVGRGFSGAYLSNNNLFLTGAYQDWITSYGGFDLEAGTPVARWAQGGLWLYAGYYYLDATVADGPATSGFSARAEARIANNFAVGATYSYDDIFQSKATGYIRYGTQPQTRDTAAEISRAEADLLAQRGLPVEREIDVRISEVRIQGTQLAQNPETNNAWVIRCVGTNASGNDCNYNSLTAAVNAGSSDVILVADGRATNLNGGSLAIPEGAVLSNGSNAPTINTQYGTANLSTIYGVGNANTKPTITNGTLTVASNTTISGFAFTNASITNRSTSNLLIANNTFTGSADGNGAINLDGVTNLTISGNTITDPTASTLTWTSVPFNDGVTASSSQIARGISVKNSDNINILNNTISNAIAEGIYIQDIGTSTNNLIQGNTIQGMKVDVNDSNLEAGIFVVNNKSGYIKIDSNTVKDNNTTVLSNGRINASDGIEINICRNGADSMNYVGLATVTGAPCSSSATLTADITNNTIDNLRTAADGIDANVGTNGNLILTATGNTIDKVGDEAITFDSFGANSNATLYIANNILKSTGDKIGSTDGIAITLHEYNALGRASNGDDADPTAAYTANSNYNITITGNTIAANTEGLNNEVGAEGIKFKIAQGLPSGSVNLNLAISNNSITVTHGDGIEIDANEDAGASVIFKGDLAITSNTITTTATSGWLDDGAPDSAKDVISSRIAEDAATSTAQISYLVTGNTINSARASDAIDLRSDSTNALSNIQFNIDGNNLANAFDKNINLRVASGGGFGIIALQGTTNFATYLNGSNTSAVTVITGAPTQINSLTNFVE